MSEQDQVASGVVGRALGSATRRRVEISQSRVWPLLHLGAHGQAKKGKSHLGLSAATSEVRAGKVMDGLVAKNSDEILIPSKPLRIAYANFDRDATTVYLNVPKDAEIVEEIFYLDQQGNPMVAPTLQMINEMLARLGKFMDDVTADARDGLIDLFIIDGGTLVWDQTREGSLSGIPMAGKTPEGDARYLPRQYGPANNDMRVRVMQRFYGLPCHTYITREVRQVWAGQNGPATDSEGKPILTSDGWNKHEHYVDLEVMIRNMTTQMGVSRVAQVGETATNPRLIGKIVPDPTFAKLYAANFGLPLLRAEDRALFEKLEAERGLNGLDWDGK